MFLRALLASTIDPAVQRIAARAVGHLVTVGGTVMADFAEAEVRRALDWLVPAAPEAIPVSAPKGGTTSTTSAPEARKFAAVLLLRQLCEAAPLHFAPHISVFFARIWSALSDPSQAIREAAAVALPQSAWIPSMSELQKTSIYAYNKYMSLYIYEYIPFQN